MKRTLSTLGRLLTRRSQAGQSIVLLAIAMIALIAFVGLVTDIALLFVRYSTLRRAVDSAAIAAAGPVREGRDYLDIVAAGYQFVQLHGIGVDAINEIFVETCESTGNRDPELCVMPRRKLVRVTAQIDSPTTFLSLIGWGTVRLEATATAEAAVVDVALVIDTSESMSKETCWRGIGNTGVDCGGRYPTDTGDDYNGLVPNPAAYDGPPDRWLVGAPWNDQNWARYCNDPNADGFFDDLVCQPFKQVREAAAAFINQLDFVRGDRVAIVTFDRYPIIHDPDCVLVDRYYPQLGCASNGPLPPIIDNEGLAREVLLGDITHTNAAHPGIGVYMNPRSSDPNNDKWDRCWTWAEALARGEPGWDDTWEYEEVAPCPNTALGGGIRAGDSALRGYHPSTGEDMGTVRHEAVWVMVLLTDGAANVTDSADPLPPYNEYGYWGYCPHDTFQDDPAAPGQRGLQPWCRDEDAFTRHAPEDGAYDADDYARDWADSAGLSPEEGGDFIAIFAIGLGAEVVAGDGIQPYHGEALLRYIADVGDNGHRDGSGDPINGVPDPDPASVAECESVPHGTLGGPDPSCGNYFYAPDANGLQAIFSEIASKMFTRVAR
ncbi:MAG: pilus assembly protein TadG-related protein [Anaerolineae bacterium]|nr:pilus assembly protein TadG-related protein [Anaerolineae bacterium]